MATALFKGVRASPQRLALNEENDCTVFALMNVLSVSYEEAHAELKRLGRKDGKGFPMGAHRTYLGRTFRDIGAVYIRRGRLFHKTANTWAEENPTGRFILISSGHAFALVDGVLMDASHPGRFRVIDAYRLVENS